MQEGIQLLTTEIEHVDVDAVEAAAKATGVSVNLRST
jgi:phosphoribosylaminoimidazole carboxylase (NCAIR synthetase)